MSSRYDDLPYPGKAYPYAHPERLASVAYLHGLDAPDIRTARVLEVGCGDGFNLISMAYQYPDARFVGVDPAEGAVLRGTLQAASLGLGNITLVEGGAEQVAYEQEPFDYILVHGVFSWVSKEVQHAILDLVGAALSDTGVAYVSYNALPGWHVRSVARDLMRTVVDPDSSPLEQVQAARDILERYSAAIPDTTLHGQVLRAVREMLVDHADSYWFHDYLSPDNHAYTVTQFVDQASTRGLQFLAEAELGDSMIDKVPSELRPLLDGVTDRLQREQLLDHLGNRGFRRTLLCRSQHALAAEPEPRQMSRLHLAMKGYVDEEVDLADDVEVAFNRRDGERIVVANSLVKSALAELCLAHPASMPHDELMARAAERIGLELDDAIRENLQRILLFLHGSQLLDLLPVKRSVRLEVSERPQMCRLARWDAMRGDFPVTNALHSASAVTPFEQLMLVLCDGSRTREDLVEVLTDTVRTGDLHIETTADQELTDEVIRDTLVHQIHVALERLPLVGLLEIDARR